LTNSNLQTKIFYYHWTVEPIETQELHAAQHAINKTSMTDSRKQIGFQLARLPVDTFYNAVGLVTWPIEVGKTLATNAVDTAFKVAGTNTMDVPCEKTRTAGKESVYDAAKSNLDISAMVYYYSELRGVVKRRTVDFAEEKGLSVAWDPKNQSDLFVLSNAVQLVVRSKKALLSSRSSKEAAAALMEYQATLEQLDGLRRKFGLDEGDMDVFKTYFDILSKQKDVTGIKSDLIRYDQFLSPQFRQSWGGTEANRQNVQNMIDSNSGICMHEIDDDFSATTFVDPQGFIDGFDAEAVWAIFVCEKRKAITVVFRGSINLKDVKVDIAHHMTDFELPGFVSPDNKDERQAFGRVHRGFYHYLFDQTKPGANGSTKSKAEEIIGMLKGDFFSKPEFQDYCLEVTGHSLGGALSTMFAFRAAAFGEFATVINVSLASPYVGDAKFRDAFVELERKRRIQHLRISNYQDIITLGFPFTIPLPTEFYKHVGMNIRLYEEDAFLAPNYRRFYPKTNDPVNGLRNMLHANALLGLNVTILRNHLCPEYIKRLEQEELAKELKTLTLDGLYGNRNVTGWDYLEK